MPVKEIPTTTVDEFWELISPVGDFVSGYSAPIFRGQANAEWMLTPSVLRKDTVDKYSQGGGRYSEVDQIVMFEYFLLMDFLHYSDDMGYLIPGDCQWS